MNLINEIKVNQKINVLIIEKNSAYNKSVVDYLKGHTDLNVIHYSCVEDTLIQNTIISVNVVLVIFDDTPADFYNKLGKLSAKYSFSSIIALCEKTQQKDLKSIFNQGVQDILDRATLSSTILIRTIHHAIARKQSQKKFFYEAELKKYMYEISELGLSQKKLLNFLSRTSVVIKKAISVDSISILQLSQDENSYSPVYLHGKNISASQMRQFTNDELLLNISNKYISQKFPASDPKVYFSDHLQDDFKIVIPHYFQLRGAKHCCGVIISGAPKKKPYGVLCVFKNKKEKFKKEEVYFLKCVSNIIATTIQRYELENVLEKKVLELNKAHRNKDEFLSVLSHELRTPLNVIIGNLDIIKVYNKNANEYKKGIEAIERNVSSELKLVEDILDVSGIISGKLSIYPKKHSIIDVINYAISIVSIAAQSKKIKIETNYDKNIEQIIGDEGRIRQIIWNLLSNAVKFTNNEGIIKVNVEKVNNNIIVSVKDNGIGLTKAQSKHVFDRFWQEDSSVKRMNTGVGLGLSIVKNLIELHGGSVNCYSAGKSLGTTFTVQLPINRKVNIIKHKKINVIKKINTKKLSKIAYKPKKRLIGKKVALIEDLVDSQIIYKFYLEAESANLDIFGSAKPALKKLVKNPYSYDIIISDIGLPDLSGYEFIKKVRELQSNSNTDKDPTKSLSLSAYARDIDREKALKAGFNDHLVKPVRAEQLIFCILDLINKPN